MKGLRLSSGGINVEAGGVQVNCTIAVTVLLRLSLSPCVRNSYD